MSSSILSSLRSALSFHVESDASRMHCRFHKRSKSMPLPSRSSSSPSLTLDNNDVKLRELVIKTSSYFSSNWLVEVLDLAISEMRKCNQEMSVVSLDGRVGWATEHMEDLVQLLDVCNAFRDRIQELREITSDILSTHRKGSGAKQNRLRRKGSSDPTMDKCLARLRKLCERSYDEDMTKGSPSPSRAKGIVVFALGAMLASLSYNPCALPLLGKKVYESSPAILIEAHKNLKEKVSLHSRKSSSCRALMKEMRDLDQVFVVGGGVEVSHKVFANSVKMFGGELENALCKLDGKVLELFKGVVSQRVCLLNCLSSMSDASRPLCY